MTSYMNFEDLPSEILADILGSAHSVEDLLALSSSCSRLRQLYKRRSLVFLTSAVSEQYGPLHDAIQLVTYNRAQPAHIERTPPLSQALLKQVIAVGRVAAKWEDLYPGLHWDVHFEDRRLLTPEERYLLRRAVYRLWLFADAFHAPSTPRTARMRPQLVEPRRALLRNFDDAALGEMFDVFNMLRKAIDGGVCPSDRAIERKFRRRHPTSEHALLFNAPFTAASSRPPFPQHQYASSNPFTGGGLAGFGSALDESMLAPEKANTYRRWTKYQPTATYDPGSEGWGDDVGHYYVVEDMLKLNPAQVLWLLEHAPSKAQVQDFVAALGDWFNNNGQTFRSTLDMVIDARGPGACLFWTDVDYGLACVAKDPVRLDA